MKLSSAIIASAVAAAAVLPDAADAHAFLLKPECKFLIPQKNFYAYWVEADKVPPASSYNTGSAERNSQAFTVNYKKLNPPSLKEFILKNEVQATGSTVAQSKGSAECGFTDPNEPPQPLPDAIEFGNYELSNPSGLHPGPCEAWCDDEIVIPFTEDCRTRFQKPIPYDKQKCVGKKRFTFYWLATHFPPFQVYIGCAPLQGGGSGGGGGGASGGDSGTSGGNSTTSFTPNSGGGNTGGGNNGPNISGNGGVKFGGTATFDGGNKGFNNGGGNNKRPMNGPNNNEGGNQNNGGDHNHGNNNNNMQNRNFGANNNNNHNNARSLDFGFLHN